METEHEQLEEDIYRKIDNFRCSQTNSRTHGLNQALNDIERENQEGMDKIRELMSRNQELIHGEAERDFHEEFTATKKCRDH